MDPIISQWIMDFLLRQPISNHILHTLLTKFPFSRNNPRLKKSLLLKSIHSNIKNTTVSEQILEFLETIETLDKELGKPVSYMMKRAYCAVAVECAAKELGEREKYMEVVERVWRGRIGGLEERESELVTEDLRKWRDDVEAAVWNDVVGKRLSERKEDAVGFLEEYLKEAYAGLGKPFLELAASTDWVEKEGGSESESGGAKNSKDGVSLLLALAANMEREEEGAPEINSPTEVEELKEKGRETDCGRQVEEAPKKKTTDVRVKHVSTGYRRSRGRVRIGYSEEDNMESPTRKYNTLPTPEVDKVQEALKTSSIELKALVKDPLPDALQLAAIVSIEMDRERLQKNVSEENKSDNGLEESNTVVEKAAGKESNAPNRSVEKPIVPCQVVESAPVLLSSSHQNNVSKPSLMERNKTAQMYEWDDSIDESPDRTSNGRKLHLDSTKSKLVSPLKKYQMTKLSRRRKVKKWSLEEEDALRDGVQKFGKGSWKLILNSKRNIFVERTEVDLKDKWRNMTK